ncbi:MAG: VOC family protein [Rhodospirillales bacterium]|nr:VOC family protein [Rhodospirillales bacterium]
MKRLHISVGVKDLQRSVEFYTTLFDAEPTVTRPGYAKWMLEDPSVNFVLDAHGCRQGVDHLGIQVDNDDELEGITTRLAQAEAPLLEQEGAECCFSKGDKSWSQDPEGVRWEAFRTHGQIGWYGADTALSEMPPDAVPESCCAVTPSAATPK